MNALPYYFKKLVELVVKSYRVYFPKPIEEITFMPYQPLTPDNIELLKKQLTPMNSDKFLKICLDALDTEVTPKDNVLDSVACAEVVSTLIKKIFPDFPILPSTKDLDWKLYSDKRFQRITEPVAGCIVVSPRTNTVNGHVGAYITSERIASNTSKDGYWRGNYDTKSWYNEFTQKRGLKTYYYKFND